jgi:hypothetical protein
MGNKKVEEKKVEEKKDWVMIAFIQQIPTSEFSKIF